MKKIDDKMVVEAKIYVLNLLDKNLPENCLYHDQRHTLDVLKNVDIIGKYVQLGEEDLNLLRICALFHDIGFIESYDEHEVKSTIYATDFLKSKNVDDSIIKQVVDAILATKVPQNPKDKISEILCDADLMYLSSKAEYFDYAELLRLEWLKTERRRFNKEEFYLYSLDFFATHQYHTSYGKRVLNPRKEETAAMIRNKISDLSINVMK